MGVAYLKDKPVADEFSYAYVEAADGSIVKIAVEKMKEALGVNRGLVSTTDKDGNVVVSIGAIADDGTITISEIKKVRIGNIIYEVVDDTARSDIQKFKDSNFITNDDLQKLLSPYLTTDDNSEIVSWIENTDTGIKVTMKDGETFDVPISQAKEFERVEYDKDTNYLHFYDAEGTDVYEPVYIEGGSGGAVTETSVVKLTNQNGAATFAVALGATLNLMFNFSSTEDDVPTGDGTCQITVNGAVKTTFGVTQGLTTIDISSFLSSGSNTVRVKCTDVYGNYKTLVYTVSVIDMYITSTFDATVPYSGDITYKYIPYGAIEKVIHILVDGTEVNTTTTSTSGKQYTYNIAALTHGVHRLEVYATSELNTDVMESEHLVYEIICIENSNTSPMIASVYDVKTLTQGEQVAIPYIVYDPTKLSTDISLDIYTIEGGNEVIFASQEITVDRSQQYWYTRKYPVGTVYFRIKYGEINETYEIAVTESDIQVEAENNDLELALSSEGRSNNESEPDNWTYGDYSTVFSNINWDTNGWVEDDKGDVCLRLNGDARAEIQFKPFENDVREYGKTIELEFAIRDVNSRDVTVISCLSDDIGFEVKADNAYIKSEQSRIFCNFKDEEKVKLAFVVESRREYRQLSIYLNGILSDVIQYPDSDNFQQFNPVNISIGSSKCGIDIYGIRSYSTALTSIASVNNYIADIKDIVEKTEIYEKNDIYDEYGALSFEECKKHNSVMVIVGDLPQAKGDKKTVKVEYYDIDDPTINYVDDAVSIDVQGTSSQYYPRKNWKLKYDFDRYIDRTHLPTKVLCIKVDYAEATGTHNTQNAIFAETLYSEKIPPQAKESMCRTTIYGKPIVLFHKADDNSEPVFYAKSNMNYDKGSEEVFGFTSEYDVECWEFCNNTSNACNFLGEIPEIWVDDFEARYPEDYTSIGRFKLMHDWVVSTRRDAATGEELEETYVGPDGTEYTHDTSDYRLAKFKMEFEEHFNMHYTLIYYVYTFFALMVDQRAKNMFMTYWGSTGKWYPYLYDNDTSFGINNEGQLVLDYYHEDTDLLDDANVYNGQNSVFWRNFKDAFADKIKETYQNLRNNKYITYDKLVDRFITNGSDKWSESIYNEDSESKYISMLKSANDASNLPQVRGSGEEHFRYFVENRINYCDSKWYAAEYANDYISLRIYTPNTWAGVEPNPAITVTPFSNMYAGVRYKANGTLYQKRVDSGVATTFSPQGETFESENNETFNDTETAIYGAHQISSIGDLAPLYCGSVNVANADKLIELKVGDGTEGYSNANLRDLSVGTNKLLKKIDVQNCPNFTSVLDLSNCPSIEEVYAKGSSITGVNFPKAGILKKAQLPATITNFTLKDQIYVEELTFEGYDGIKTLWIENCPTIDGFDILSKASNVDRLRLTNVSLTYETAAEMLELAERNIAGIDENGSNIDKMWIDGTCHINTLTGAEYLAVKAAFPYMNITYDALTAELIFMSEDGNTELTRQTIRNGGNGSDPVTAGTISRPSKSSTAQYTYTFSGWSLTPGGSASSTALNAVEADRTVYAAFTSAIRTYTVKFYNGSTLLQTVTNVPYGGSASYAGSTPQNNTTGNPDDFEFYGWSPKPTNIQGDTNCYAQYHDLREITDSWDTIAANVANGTATTKYSVGATKMLNIGNNKLPTYVDYPYAFFINKELHLLNRGNHYKWNGSSFELFGSLAFDFYHGLAVMYNDEIHIMSTTFNDEYKLSHYKWNSADGWKEVSTLPYACTYGRAVIYNNEIHILGGTGGDTNHYKWTGTEWTSVSTLPYRHYNGSAVVLNNEIHIISSSVSDSQYLHYKWDGTTWTSVSTLPYRHYNGSAVVLNNEIHIIGGGYSAVDYKNHYKWNGTTWTYVESLPLEVQDGCAVVDEDENTILIFDSNKGYIYHSNDGKLTEFGITETIPMQIVAHNHDELPDGVMKWESMGKLPYSFYSGATVLLNDEIHILGCNGSSYRTRHYKYDGSTWTSVSTLPYNFYNGSAVLYNDEIHILGGTGGDTNHYKWTGTEWISVSTLPYNFSYGVAAVLNGEIHILGSYNTSYRLTHYKWNGTEWTSVGTPPFGIQGSSAIVLNNELHILGSYMSDSRRKHYKYNGTEWTSVSTIPFDFYYASTIVYNGEIHLIGSNSGSQYNKVHYKWNGNEWTEVSTLPCSFYKGSVVIYNNKICIVGSEGHYTAFFACSGSSWESVSTLPFKHYDGYLVTLNDEIHILGGVYNKTGHYKYDSAISSWVSVSTLPVNVYEGAGAVVLNGEIHILGSYESDIHYKWDGTSWTSVGKLPGTVINSSSIVFNNEIHLFGTLNMPKAHYKWNGSSWTSISTLDVAVRGGCPVVCNGELYFLIGYEYYKWNGSKFNKEGSIPISLSYGSAVECNGEIHIFDLDDHYSLKDGKWTKCVGTPEYVGFNEVIVCKSRIHFIHQNSHYELHNPKAALTFIGGTLMSYGNNEFTNVTDSDYGWQAFNVRRLINESGSIYKTLPNDLQSVITTVKKLSNGGFNNQNTLVVTDDKVWVPSVCELGGEHTNNLEGQGETYSIFTDKSSRIRHTPDGNVKLYLTRSTHNKFRSYIYGIGASGDVGLYAQDTYNNVDYILIGFCI